MSKNTLLLSTQDKYYKIVSGKEDSSNAPNNEIKVSLRSRGVASYIRYALKLFLKENQDTVIIKSAGNAASRGVTIAEVLRHRIPDLHQINRIAYNEIKETYVPREEGLDEIVDVRIIPVFDIKLTTKPTNQDIRDPGYQKPLPKELVEKVDLESLDKKKENGKKKETQSDISEKNSKQSNSKKYYEDYNGKSNGRKRGKSVSRAQQNDQKYYEDEEYYRPSRKTPRKGSQKYYDDDYDRDSYYQPERTRNSRYNDYEVESRGY